MSDGDHTAHADTDAGSDADEQESDDLPADVIDAVERLTRLARDAVDDAEAAAYRDRRETVLEDHTYTARIRTDEDGDVLVCHPEEWHDSDAGVIRTDRIEDLSRAHEVPLSAQGAGTDDWETVEAENRELVTAVRERHGDVHGDNAAAFADFMGNHYGQRMTAATRAELEEFYTEYFVRNAWPSEAQRRMVEQSVEYVFEAAKKTVPGR